MPDTSPVIVWFRDDQRVADNPALAAAAATGRPVLCVYLHDPSEEGLRPLGGAARWWLHGSLDTLARSLARRGGRLDILRGRAEPMLESLSTHVRADAVFWNRRYDGAGRELDTRIKATLKARGIRCESFNATLLREPWDVATRAGTPFSVFTAYWRAATALGPPPLPLPAPAAIPCATLPSAFAAVPLDALQLEPHAPDWAHGFHGSWRRGEDGAQAQFEAFLADGFAGYAANRDRPEGRTTSRLSPYLRFGNISPRQVWHGVAARSAAAPARERDCAKFFAELGWREFSYHLLYYRPDMARRPVRTEFEAMPWANDRSALRAWQRGRTGYPIVDAGMRELWATGWMHNRVRMIVASFLTKHLLIDWRSGEEWFWDTLVDADPANNPASWQWVAGCGMDAAPFFRIFNPVLQGAKFDPAGHYVKHWLPQLADAPDGLVHNPWKSPGAFRDYPAPIVDHDAARRRALAAWNAVRGG